MIKLNTYNQKGEKTGSVELAESIFGVKSNSVLLKQAVVAQMANERQVLAHTKDRSEVRGGGKKPWRQKGTGRARAGSSRSPIWIGGGVTFGPTKDRNFKKDINRKMKQKAMFMAMSDRVANDSIFVMEDLKMDNFKTKDFNNILKNTVDKNVKEVKKSTSAKASADKEEKEEKSTKKKVKKDIRRSVLVVNDSKEEKTKYSARNLEGVKVINLDNINLVDLLKYKNLIIAKNVVKALEAKYLKKAKKKVEKTDNNVKPEAVKK